MTTGNGNNESSSRLDRIERTVEANAQAIAAILQITASNARAVEANSAAIAKTRQELIAQGQRIEQANATANNREPPDTRNP